MSLTSVVTRVCYRRRVRSAILGVLLGCASTPAPAAILDAGVDEPQQLPLPPRDAPACARTTFADSSGFSRSFTLVSSGDVERDRAFYLTSVLASDASLMSALAADSVIGPIAKAREAALRDAPGKCGTNVACYAAALRINDADAIAKELPAVVGDLAKSQLRPSGMFARRASDTDALLVSGAWTDTANALNATYDAYVATLDAATLQQVVAQAAASPQAMAFFEPLLSVDLGALAIQKRDEATRYEPLATTNATTIKAIGAMSPADWATYPYSMILVPGLGPNTLDPALSAGGAKRCDLAAARFQAKYAPFILVSGGHVHPDRTPYSEAMEMRKYLETQYSIPESAILVDPHARHTTTNLRNATREIFRYGVPADKVVLVTSDLYQSAYIAYWESDFGPRNKKELGFLPWRALAPIGPTDTCMLPSPTCLQFGADPLDP